MLLRRTRPDSKIQWLADLPWWGDLSREDLLNLAATADRTTIPTGQQVMEQGEFGLEAAVVVSGELEVVRDGEVMAHLGPGTWSVSCRWSTASPGPRTCTP